MIYHVKESGAWVISSHDVWLPGSYETEKAARYAFRFDRSQLASLQDQKNEMAGGSGGVITFDDLKRLSKTSDEK